MRNFPVDRPASNRTASANICNIHSKPTPQITPNHTFQLLAGRFLLSHHLPSVYSIIYERDYLYMINYTTHNPPKFHTPARQSTHTQVC